MVQSCLGFLVGGKVGVAARGRRGGLAPSGCSFDQSDIVVCLHFACSEDAQHASAWAQTAPAQGSLLVAFFPFMTRKAGVICMLVARVQRLAELLSAYNLWVCFTYLQCMLIM